MYDINVASGRAGQIMHEDNHDSLYCNNSIESKTIIGPEKKIRQLLILGLNFYIQALGFAK